jgi:hypothetical protein
MFCPNVRAQQKSRTASLIADPLRCKRASHKYNPGITVGDETGCHKHALAEDVKMHRFIALKFLPDDVAQGLIVFLFFFATLIAAK